MATNFRVKIGKIGLFTFIRSTGIPKLIEYHHSDFKSFISTLHANLANFGPVTTELKRVVGVHPLHLK